eukprot:1021476-Pyramimonas_sp.AAC.1
MGGKADGDTFRPRGPRRGGSRPPPQAAAAEAAEESPKSQEGPPDPVALAQAQVSFWRKWVGVDKKEYHDAVEYLKQAKMQALRGK